MTSLPKIAAVRGVAVLAVIALLVSIGALALFVPKDHRAQAGPPSNNAVAKVISDSADLIEGPLSRGRLGDYLLANDEIQVVVQQPQRNLLSIGQFGGQIIDADLVRAPLDPERDSFEEFALGIHLENTAHYTSVSVLDDGSDGSPAVIRATGVDDLLDFVNPSSQVADFGVSFPPAYDDIDLPVTFQTDYTLAPDDSFVRVDTTITNTHSTNAVQTFLTEFVSSSGELEQFLPGYGFGEPLFTSACARCNFIAWSGIGDAEGVSYGYIHNIANSTIVNAGGVTIPALGVNAVQALLGLTSPNYTIAANGGTVTVTRYFAVGDGDAGAIVDIRNEILGYSTGTISGTVTRGASPVEGVDVVVLGPVGDGPDTPKNPVAHYITDSSGAYFGTLPAGSYTAQAHLDGHMAASPDPANITITASATTVQDFTIADSGRLKVTIVDENSNPIAAKVSVVGFDPYPDPQVVANSTGLFADVFEDRMPFGVSDVRFVDPTGDSGEFYIEPGSYQVVVSHGTEYSVTKHDVTVTAGALTTVNAQIARVLDTTGFVSGDFHVHQIDSPDSDVSKRDRVISQIAEGVDFFTPSDHEHRTDLTPAITDLSAGSLISVAPSNENTTADYGHFNAWPVTIDPAQVNGGALDWARAAPAGQDFPSFGNYGLTPAEIFDALLADPGTDTVQINHIDSFFGEGGLAVDTAYIPPRDFVDNAVKRLDPSIANLFDSDFTGLEIWQGTDRNDMFNRFIGRNMGDWINLINQGIPRTGIADSDTHKRISSQAGFPRTFLASPTDAPGSLGGIADTLSGHVNAGRVIGSNGPFITVTSSAASTGQSGGLALGEPTLISTTNGSATITVDVQSPLWAEFDRVEYYVNTVPTPNNFDNDVTTPPYWNVAPFAVQNAGVDFTVNTVNDFPSITDAQHLEATTSLNLSGLAKDTWVIVLVRGTDNVSEPLFPVVPMNLATAGNTTLANLTDGNLGESGVTALAFSNPLFISVTNDADYDTTPVDNDRDGCTNNQESAAKASAAIGGGRSPSNFWDFFDTPTGVSLTRDKAVAGTDFFALLARFGSSGSPTIDPLTTPPPAPAYHTAYDRGPSVGPNGWNLSQANGAIAGTDFFALLTQFGHTCA